MFINNVTNHPRKNLDHLIETLKVTYGFDLTKIKPQNLFAYANKYEAIKNRIVSESTYNSYHSDPAYAKAVLITEAIKLLIEVAPKRKKQKGIKESQINEERMKKDKELANKDYDGDGEIESPKDEVWGSRMAAAKKAGRLKEAASVAKEASTKDAPKKTVTQKGLDPNDTVYVQGEHTNNNRPFKKKFANMHAAEKWMKKEDGNVAVSRVVNEARLLEDENLDQAETLLAAKDLSDRLQKMAEDAAKMAVDDLMPLVDTMKSQFGQEQANGFNDVVKQNLQTVLDAIIKAKDETDNAILSVQRGQTPGAGGDLAKSPAATDSGGDKGGDIDFEKEFAATPSASGPKNEPLGRAKKEPMAEGKKGKIPPQFLANIKKKKAEANKKPVKEGVMTCQECDTGMYEEDHRGRMKCNECGSTMVIGEGVSQYKKSSKKCMECDDGVYEETKSGKMKCCECGHMMTSTSGLVSEDVGQPSMMGYETPILQKIATTGMGPDGRPVSQDDKKAAQQVLDARKNGTVTEAKRKVNPYAVGMAQAEKETGDKPPLKKSTIVRAHAIAKEVSKKEESQLAKVNSLLENLITQYNKLNELLEKHKKQFKKQVNEGKQVDILNVGYGLEGDAIREKMIRIKKSINETKLLKIKIIESIQEKKKSIAEAKQEIVTFNQQLGSKPYGVVGFDSNNKKVQKFFESVSQRTMWLEFHQERLTEHRLINPEMIQKAQTYLKKKIQK